MFKRVLSSSFECLKNFIWTTTHKDAAKMLIGMGAIGFALSSLAQCFAIKINDRIDNKKKKFLLRQEAADGAVNIGLFLAVTSSVWKFSDKIIKSMGLLGKKNLQDALNDANLKPVIIGGRIATTTIASVIACNIVTPLVRNLIAGKITAYKEKDDQKTNFLEIYNQYENTPFKNFNAVSPKYSSNATFKPNYVNPFNSFGKVG